MGIYLENYLQLIPESQREKLRSALSKERSLREYAPNIINALEDMTLEQILDVKNQQDFLDSEIYNQNVSGIFADLNILYNQTETIDMAIINNNLLFLSNIEALRKELAMIRGHIHSLKTAVQSTATATAEVESFTSLANLEPRSADTEHLYTDRDGTIIPEEYTVYVDTRRQGECRLPIMSDIDTLRNEEGNLTATVRRLGELSRTSGNPSFPISNAIDGSLETFWGEVALTDSNLNVTVGDVDEGAMVAYEVILDKPRVINEISLDPFGFYPVDIIAIQYQEDTNAHTELKYLVGPLGTYATMEPIEISEGHSINFAPVTIRRLVFVLRQKNYDKVEFLVREADISRKDMWDVIISKHNQYVLEDQDWRERDRKIINPAYLQSALDEASGWNAYLKEYQKELEEWYRNPWA